MLMWSLDKKVWKSLFTVETRGNGVPTPSRFAINEFEAVSKWRIFWVRSHTFFVSSTPLVEGIVKANTVSLSEGCCSRTPGYDSE